MAAKFLFRNYKTKSTNYSAQSELCKAAQVRTPPHTFESGSKEYLFILEKQTFIIKFNCILRQVSIWDE